MPAKPKPRRLEYVPLADLVPSPRNPKRHDLASLRASLGRFGYLEPVVLDERTGRLVSGHGRAEALAGLEAAGEPAPEGVAVDGKGRWSVPALRGWSSADDAEAEAALVAVNRITEAGGWDDRSLAALLSELAVDDRLAGTGYGGDDLAALLKSLEGPAPPAEFPEVGDDLPTEHRCPSCGYEWSGSPQPGGVPSGA